MSGCPGILSRYHMVNFPIIRTIAILYLAREGELWDIVSGFNVWYIF